MKTLHRFFASVLSCLICLSATAVHAGEDQVPDFSLLDVNFTSTTYDQMVSPRDYLETATGWYFGHAT